MTTDSTPIDWNNFTIQEFKIREPITPSAFVFHSGSGNTEVGRFEVIDGQMRFTGNVDEATKVMIEYFTKQFNQKIRELIVAYGGDPDNVPVNGLKL